MEAVSFDSLLSMVKDILTCLMATISPVALSIALYTTPKLPPVPVSYSYYRVDSWLLTAQFLQDLVLAASHIIGHRCEGVQWKSKNSIGSSNCVTFQ